MYIAPRLTAYPDAVSAKARYLAAQFPGLSLRQTLTMAAALVASRGKRSHIRLRYFARVGHA